MADIHLTQSEADALIAMEKHRANEDRYSYPLAGSVIIPVESPDKREQFLLDIHRARIDLLKGKYQNRARQVIVLVRLDFGSAPHRNPDDEEIGSPHFHVYREGYGDKWAVPVPIEQFPRMTDLWGTLEDFMRFCHITRPPHIERGLFS
ncbi:MAG: hypothetical protein WA373_04155 [Burkholderiales bacterium]